MNEKMVQEHIGNSNESDLLNSHSSASAEEMNTAVIIAPEKIEIRKLPRPVPGSDEVLIRLAGCGVCASNIPVWQGREWFNYPIEPGSPGHEGWGWVESVGKNVKDLKPGDYVAALTYHAYSEFDIASAGSVVKLPPPFFGKPFPGEPLGCAMNIFRRSDIHAGHTVAIIGAGFLGALLIQLASAAGARVIAISKRPFSLEVARSFGASETIEMDDHWRIIEKVKELTGGSYCQRVIEATGKQWPLDLAGELTAVRGKLIIAGYHQDGLRQVNMQLWNWRGIDVINAHEREQEVYIEGIRAAVEAVMNGTINPFPLFSHYYELDQLGEALRITEERPDGFTKALVKI